MVETAMTNGRLPGTVDSSHHEGSLIGCGWGVLSNPTGHTWPLLIVVLWRCHEPFVGLRQQREEINI